MWRRVPWILLLVACGDAAAEREHGGPPAPVEVAHGRIGALELEQTYLGTVRSIARAQIAAEASGRVLEIAVAEGDHVEVGDPLVRVDSDLARVELSRARAQARRAEAEQSQAEEDARRLSRAGPQTVARVEIERASSAATAMGAQQETARSEVSRAREALSRHVVAAPFSGVVATRQVDVGGWVSVGDPLVELVAEDRIEVLVRVEPELLEHVRAGFEARVSRGDRQVAATVVGVVRALDTTTRTAQLRLRPVEPAPWLLAGAAVDVRFHLSRDGPGVVIPRDALVPGVTQTRVVRVIDGAAQPLTVQIVERGRAEVRVVAEGLTPDDVLVVRGNDRLRPGQPVRVVEGGTPAD